MDADCFDTLIRALNSVPRRRRSLFTTIALSLGALGASGDGTDIAAKKRRRKKKKKPETPEPPLPPPPPTTCRGLREYCAGICAEGACEACCSKNCGFTSDIPDLVCCVAKGQACPSECAKNGPCPGCCGSSLCVSNGTCF